MRRAIVSFVVAFLLFSGARVCPAAGEEVLARVGDEVITLQDLLPLGSAIPALSVQGDVEPAKRKLLEFLIGQVLFAREAARIGLDSDPLVKAKLKQARTSVLAQEYLRRRTTEGVSVGSEEIKAYFEAHRAEFGGKELKDVEGQIKARLAGEAMGELARKTKDELWKKEGVTIDEAALKAARIPAPTR